ncbi:MAG: site-2 protease family protein [Parcubacteria group bacterium]|nr:site-2 protease family protein [Parcubacteria group bacterium]
MLITIAGFIIVLGFLVLVHELGHFLVARAFGIAVEEFGLGFPPKLFSKKSGATVYSINAIPLGGFVKIKGEDGGGDVAADSFGGKSAWQRACVIVAGVSSNVIAGWLLLSILFMAGAPIERTPDIAGRYIHDPSLAVSEVLPGSPADEAGLAAGDTILSADGQSLFQEYIAGKSAQSVSLRFRRAKTEQEAALVPRVLDDQNLARAIIGVGLAEVGVVRFPPHKAFVAGTVAARNYLERIAAAFWSIARSLARGRGAGDSLGGPLAIAVATGDALDLGFSHAVIFTAILSFNLAIINILPFPALDGGRLIFLAAEAIRRKPSKQELEAWFHRVGFALLMLLAVVITYRDLARFGGRIWKAVLG